jgi:hypothetical protein
MNVFKGLLSDLQMAHIDVLEKLTDALNHIVLQLPAYGVPVSSCQTNPVRKHYNNYASIEHSGNKKIRANTIAISNLKIQILRESSHRLLDSESAADAAGATGALTRSGMDSNRLCREGALKVLRLAAATKEAEKLERASNSCPSSSSLSTLAPGTAGDVRETSSSRIM